MFRSLSDPSALSKFGRNEFDPGMVRLPINEKELSNKSANRRFGYFKSLDLLDSASCC